ncbi:sensor histidine kinase [Methanothermobacter thermautotrophicus]|uniref:Sensory transduction histidine kinase n=1 Tax=Methanothermobacter thermautotrophicus (strain ATCC 29096 / DSM 1053 / JCM 10044 / NBRC 100330 / Delta H) TaxID=187420 RepID=O26568_METTH|nr:PAS domain S-box protein [Methanothermobacter thermautotrophicus]AAB84974.1 sensory transduction histidine kinase [Methanothermobacter thermautotrophicus str. Delta H]WBF06745.1 PAS domain S-box protein [Methanothermobacter thermautotrophicus]
MLRILLVRDTEADVSDLLEKLSSAGVEVTVADKIERAAEADTVLIYTTPARVSRWASCDIRVPFMYLLDFDENVVVTCPHGCLEKPPGTEEIKACMDFIIRRLVLEEERYRELFENINTCVAVYEAVDDGEDFLFTDFNRAAEETERIKREDVLGKRVTEVFPGVEEFGLLDVLRRVYRTGNPEHYPLTEYRDERISGWRENFVYRLPSGEVVAVYEDRAKEKQLQEELEEKEKLYRTIFENTGAATTIVDEDTTIILANREFERLSGYSGDEIEGKKSWTEFVVDEDLERMMEYHKIRRRDPRLAPRRYTFRFQNRHGEVRHMQMIVGMIPGTAKSVTSMVDITEIKEAEENLRRSLSEKELLLREVHHRVKNNLQIISSLLNLQSLGTEGKEVRDVLMESQGRIKVMAMIHEHLYRSESLASINFRDYVERLVEDIIISHGSSIRKVIEVDDIKPDIDTAIPLGLIINELVTNSVKYAFPDGTGSVTVRIRSHDDDVSLVVADDGVGLPEDIEPENTDTLGLSLVSILTEQLDGTLTIRRDHGTEFRISFPV